MEVAPISTPTQIHAPTVPPTSTVEAPPAETATESTLLNCETNIGEGVPRFYSMYFRCVDIALDGGTVVISSSNLPPHLSYYYGEGHDRYELFDFDRREEYRPNPGKIAETHFSIRIPVSLVAAGVTIDGSTVNRAPGDTTDYPIGIAGVALDGVALFNPLARPGDDIEDEKFTFDSNGGHPQEQVTYHYTPACSVPYESSDPSGTPQATSLERPKSNSMA